MFRSTHAVNRTRPAPGYLRATLPRRVEPRERARTAGADFALNLGRYLAPGGQFFEV